MLMQLNINCFSDLKLNPGFMCHKNSCQDFFVILNFNVNNKTKPDLNSREHC